MPANTQDGTTALSSRARFCAIIFCRVRPDNVANLHCTPSLLRTRPERPSHRPAAEQRDDVAPPNHSITSSARAMSVDGERLAVERLMTISNFVGCATGRSAGFSPLRTRPVYADRAIAFLW